MLAQNRLECKFIILNEEERTSNTSYLHKTKPDYLLEIKGAGVKLEDEAGQNLFSHGVDECFFLNYGDLFISAINVLEGKDNVESVLSWLISSITSKQDELKTVINESLISGSELNHGALCRLNEEYSRLESALSFATFLSMSLFEDKYRDGLLSAALTSLLSLPDEPLAYGALNTKDFRENLIRHNLFSEIKVEIRYKKRGEEYIFNNLFSLIGFEVHKMIENNYEIKICKNCGRFFIPASRKDEKYCDNFFQSPFKTCKQVAFIRRLDSDEILREYRKIYKTQNARKQRNAQRSNIAAKFSTWSEYAKGRLIACQNGQITLDEMKTAISSSDWMYGK